MSLFSRSLRNNWREASAVADAEEVDAIGIDKLVVFKGAKGRAIAGKLGIEIIFRTISFAIADALFIDPKKAESGQLCELSKEHAGFVSRVFRCFNAVAAQPAGDENDGRLTFQFPGLGDDGAQTLSMRCCN